MDVMSAVITHRRPESRRRPEQANARLSRDEMERLRRAAAERQVSVSTYVRDLIVAATSATA